MSGARAGELIVPSPSLLMGTYHEHNKRTNEKESGWDAILTSSIVFLFGGGRMLAWATETLASCCDLCLWHNDRRAFHIRCG